MNNKRRNLVFVCLVTFVEIWNFISSADISFTKYHYESSLAGYKCVANETAFEIDNVFDPVRCGKLCYLGNMCRSVFYQPDSHKCIGCRVNPRGPTCRLEPHLGSKYFRTKPTYTNNSDCKDIFEDNLCHASSRVYDIRLWMSKKMLPVFCDMDTDGGGWTVIQNRFSDSVDFARNFSNYENGFGDINGEFWLGLKYIQELASQGPTDIRLEMTRNNGEKFYQRFTDFKLSDDTDYKIFFEEGPADGTQGISEYYSFNYHNGRRFSTFDRDVDDSPGTSCAKRYRGGWWYGSCATVNLNGYYCTPGGHGDTDCFIFEAIHLKASRILIRRV